MLGIKPMSQKIFVNVFKGVVQIFLVLKEGFSRLRPLDSCEVIQIYSSILY